MVSYKVVLNRQSLTTLIKTINVGSGRTIPVKIGETQRTLQQKISATSRNIRKHTGYHDFRVSTKVVKNGIKVTRLS